ncbi:hypothetical protein S40288_01578 [Stachybotrys chartarum IBT 40288]|nr:hypothetical protein S40288_01578 [Stachybotrys chartarum IBT 40288]
MPVAFATNHLASNPSPTSPIRSHRSHSIIPSPTLLPGSGQLRQATVPPNARRPLPNEATTAFLTTPTRPTQHNVTQRRDATGTANFCSPAASSCSPEDPSPGPVIVAHTAVTTSFLPFPVCHRSCPRTLREGSTSTYRGIIFIEAGAVDVARGVLFRATLPPDGKVDSSQALVASHGALQNLTSYLNGTFANLTTVLHESSEYLSETLGVPTTVVYSSLAALVAVPLTMARYGWASSGREQISPYSSMTGGAPAVTDDDFSYITSQDLDDPGLGPTETHYRNRSHSAAPGPEDDVLLIKSKGVTYPAHFPAYSIGDGKLRVRDVRDRVGLMMELSERATRHLKLIYKGKQLKEPAAPIRDYGVKNKSELMAMVSEVDDGSSPSEEEMVIVDEDTQDKKSRRRRRRRGKPSDKGDSDLASSPRDSNSTLNPPKSPPAASGPMKKLDTLAGALANEWLPRCDAYIASPPSDPKKSEEEHRKLSESLLQQILLKLDEVDTEGIVEVRARRKELVTQVQALLKKLDVAHKGSR